MNSQCQKLVCFSENPKKMICLFLLIGLINFSPPLFLYTMVMTFCASHIFCLYATRKVVCMMQATTAIITESLKLNMNDSLLPNGQCTVENALS